MYSFMPSLIAACSAGFAQVQLICGFDPLGVCGNYYSLFKDYQLAAKRWGVSLDLRPYSDDKQLDRSFRDGEHDWYAISLTNFVQLDFHSPIRARQNRTIEDTNHRPMSCFFRVRKIECPNKEV